MFRFSIKKFSVQLSLPHHLPKRMILIRHGESKANVDPTEYGRTPDWKIELTEQGIRQAQSVGEQVRTIVAGDPVYFYVSPYRRAKQTLGEIKKEFQSHQVVGEREDPRLREQDVGNYQDPAAMKQIWHQRDLYGRFFYRFPNGESGADVCDRVSSFLDSLFRERNARPQPVDTNVIIVTHGLMIRLFIKRWFHFNVDVFQEMRNPGNCDMIILDRAHEPFRRMVLREESKTILRIPSNVTLEGRYGTRVAVPRLPTDEEDSDAER